jgi:flavorubredoxin
MTTFYPLKNNLHKFPHTKIVTKCLTVQSLLKKYNVNRVDILQIDAEGYDCKILGTWDWAFKPKIIRFEYANLTKNEQKNTIHILRGQKYNFTHMKEDVVAWDLPKLYI